MSHASDPQPTAPTTGLEGTRSPLPLTAEMRELVIHRFNETDCVLRHATVADVLEAQAAATPNATALVFEGEALTYDALHGRANQVARLLQARGVGPDVIVGVSLRRSVDMIVTLLGILKAGGAFLPLDPTWPAERLEFMIKNAGSPLVVSESGDGPDRLAWMDERSFVEALDTDAPPRGVGPLDLAYCLYTSGSTGAPKCAQVEQIGMVNMLEDACRAPGFAGCRWLATTTLSFDFSVMEIFIPLACGGTVVLVPEDVTGDGSALLSRIERHGVNVLSWPPALWPVLLETGWKGAPGTKLLSGGERLSPALAAALLARGEVYNYYGPCEAAVYCAWNRVTSPEQAPIVGRPASNTRIYVVDEHLAPLPIGAEGELCISGVGVGRGYLNRPDLSAERFVPDPFRPGVRLFRTGDRARWLSDGRLEVLGRLDDQAKIGGARIEPGEVEAALLGHPSVAEAVAAVRSDGPRGPWLVAWVVPASTALPASADLRAWLRERLPPHLVPSAVLTLDALPLSLSGKVDRQALPSPNLADSHAATPPRSPLEEVLASIFAELLARPAVGIDDDFFELGGTSLLAMRAMARVRDALGVRSSMRAIFEAPTVAALARALGPATRLAPLSAPMSEAAAAATPSFEQEQIWLAAQTIADAAAYNEAHGLWLDGPLDLVRLHHALDGLVARHAVLRTRFSIAEEGLVPLTHAPSRVALEVFEVPSEAEAERRAAAEAQQPFDLERGPLLRVRLMRLGGARHLLLLVMHHIACDGWSVDVIWHDLDAMYAGRDLAPLPMTYSGWAVARRHALRSEIVDPLLTYWTSKLDGAPLHVDLPTDRRRPSGTSAAGALSRRRLPAALVTDIDRLARRHGCTRFMAMLAAFGVLLHRWCGEDDFIVGTPFAGRDSAQTEPLVGYFVNMLALRLDCGGDPSFTAFLARTRETVLEAFAHADLPFPMLVKHVRSQRDVGRSAIFDVVFAVHDATRGDRLGDLRARPLAVPNGAAKFDLDLSVVQGEDGSDCILEYRADLFDETSMTRLLGCYERLLRSIAEDPSRAIAQLALTTADERREVLEGFNPPPAGAAPLPLHRLVDDAARRNPHGVAVSHEGEEVTYAQLDAQVARLCHHLQQIGVTAESRVGLHLPRSIEQIVAMLAILRAGAAYVPLDPTWPAERTAWIVEDAALDLVVSRQALDTRARLVDPAQPEDDRQVEVPAPPHASPTSAAYVIYTSGSTGRPKGVVVEHGSASRYAREAARRVGLSSGDRVLQFASASFDASVEEIFATLASGATLLLRTEEMISTMAVFLERCRDLAVSVLCLPTAFWHDLTWEMEADGLSLPPAVRVVVIGGERALPERVARWQRLAPRGVRLFNTYGPTEATVAVTWWETPDTWSDDRECPIGAPLPHVLAYVLDANGQPAPVGFPGELYLGGQCLAREYLHRPELTAQRFIANPFGPGRLYRTGDRARWLADGTLAYCGRLDRQVKIRGFRIEPGEVEAVLERHPCVREAAVTTPIDANGHARLVAHVATSSPLGIAELRTYLKRTLPAPAVPSAFALVDALPRTASGKIDRAALPAPHADDGHDETHPLPQTPVERALTLIWCEVLGVARVGRHDDFFTLGGHSLLAARVLARIREAFGVAIPMPAMLEAPTVVGLAAAIERLEGQPIPRPVPIPRDRPLPLSFAQQAMWLINQLEPDSALYNVPMALRLRGPLDLDALRASLDAMVARHEVLRTTYVAEEGRPFSRVGPPAPLPMALEDVRALPTVAREAAAVEVATRSARQPFDLSRDWPLRAHVVRISQDDHLLVLVFHHVAFDARSAEIVVDELSAQYGSRLRGDIPALPSLPLQHADYAAWRRQMHEAALVETRIAWWRQHLAGVAQVLDLPLDLPRPARPSHRGGVATRTLGHELAAQVAALSRAHGVTTFLTLLAAYEALLHRLTDATDVVVGCPVADRALPETDNLIGFLVETLVFRADCSNDPSFADLLGRLRKSSLGAYAHAVPFETLVNALVSDRDTRVHPLVQAAFSYLPTVPERALRMPGIVSEPVEIETGVAKLELHLAVTHADEGLCCRLEYDAELFTEATAQRMLAQLESLLTCATRDAQQPLSRLALQSDAERRRVTIDFNRTERPYPRDQALGELFAEQARRAPEAIALTFGARVMTYGELDASSALLADGLRARGVGPEVRVALLAERSVDMIVATLAIVRAGGAYVPLDPSHPAERIALVLEDAAPAVVLAQRAFVHLLPAGQAVRVLGDETQADAPTAVASPGEASAGALAYVMYTSGSTGRPKGVAVEHRGIVRLVRNCDYARFASDEVFLQLSSISFDAATLEIWGPLLNGARLALMTPGPPSLAEIARVVREHEVTTLFLTTALFHAMVETHLEGLRGLRQLVVGGDTMSPAHARRARQALPHVRLINGYGPTENTTFTTCHTVRDDDPSASISIGRPIANTRVYIVDRHLQPLPVGVPGELCTAGDGLARGYLNRVDLTAERFVSACGETRLYRTGDRARWREDGTIEFLGRIDRQVKIRGFRVEPGEVEAVIGGHPDVRGCVVVALPDESGGKRLVAWVVTTTATAASLGAWMAERVPAFLVPSAFVPVDALPLTVNGKIDARALPAPSQQQTTQAVPPRDSLERALVEIWEEVLDVRPVGVTDRFFDLGGHSLSGARVVARIEQRLGDRLSLTTLFEAQTIERIGEVIRGESSAPARSTLVALETRGIGAPMYWVHSLGGDAGGGFFYYRPISRHLAGLHPSFGIRAPEPSFERIEVMAEAYLDALLAAHAGGPIHLGGFCFGGVVAYEMARRLRARGCDVGLVVLVDSSCPIDAPVRTVSLGKRIARLARTFASMNATQRWRAVKTRMRALARRLSGGSRRVSKPITPLEEAMDLTAYPPDYIGPAKRHWEALQHYVPGRYEGQALLFCQRDDDETIDGWANLIDGPLEVHGMQGPHEAMMDEPGATRIAEVLRARLSGASPQT